MKDYTISEIIGALTLDGQNVNRMTFQKKIALRAIAVAELFDSIAEKEVTQKEILNTLDKIKASKFSKLKKVETNIVGKLEKLNLIKKKLALLSCDLNYYSAGVEILEYSADYDFYKRETEWLRCEILEPERPNLEAIILFVLIRESGFIHDIFSIAEQNTINSNLSTLIEDEIFAPILSIDFHSDFDSLLQSFVKGKHILFKNPYLQGIAVIFPFLDRRVSIFIDMVIFGTNFKTRQEAVVDFLRTKGFAADLVKFEDLNLIKIDNMLYQTWSSVRTVKLPIQGMVIQPYYR